MNKIVGGLLVVTLLSNPSIMKFDFLAYTIYKAETVIISGVKKEQERIEQAATSSDVDGILSDIDKNKRDIKGLLRDKYNLISKIQSVMNLKAYTKTLMSDYQIETYQKFNRYYEIESKNLTLTLDSIENEKIETAKRELLRADASVQTVYQELKALNDSQYDAIYNLNNIIERGSQTLAII